MADKLKKTNYANLDPESCKVNKQLFNELFYNILFFFASAVPWSIITAAPWRECSYEKSWWTDGRDMKFVYPSLSWDPSACQPATHAGAHARQVRTHTHTRQHSALSSSPPPHFLLRHIRRIWSGFRIQVQVQSVGIFELFLRRGTTVEWSFFFI